MMTILPTHLAYGMISGVLVGFTLGLVGGGGSVLAVPLLVYFVGAPNPHEAIGTSAAAVAANALLSLVHYARAGVIKWRCASIFALFGSIGAYAGSTLGKLVDGEKLLAFFGGLMIVVSIAMLRGRDAEGYAAVRLNRENFPRLVAAGLTSGSLSGFFGVGGGFLIVPGLMLASGMPILNAVGSSLIAVSAFAVTTAASYAYSDLVDWEIAGTLLIGGGVGGLFGAAAGHRLAGRRGALNVIFAALIFAVAVYVLWRAASATGFAGLGEAR